MSASIILAEERGVPNAGPQPRRLEAMNIAMTERKPAASPSLKGKVSLVTGSTSGIGLGIARALAGAGSAIVLNGFGKPEEIEAAQEGVAKDFGVGSTIPAPTCRTRPRSPR